MAQVLRSDPRLWEAGTKGRKEQIKRTSPEIVEKAKLSFVSSPARAGTPAGTPSPRYESQLLGMTFISEAEKEKAEREYQAQQGLTKTQKALRDVKDIGSKTITRLKELEAKRQATPSRISDLNKEITEKYNQWLNKSAAAEKPKPFSITQKYFEAFGVKFYKPDERQKLIDKALLEFNDAADYQQQQQAISNLRIQGIPVQEVNGQYVIKSQDVVKIVAPTSKWGNIAVGTADVLLKSAIFSPYMSTGAAAKGKAKISAKGEVRYVRKFSELSDKEYSDIVNQLRVKASRSDLRKFYEDALKTGDKDLIKARESILKDVLGDKGAAELMKDVAAQQGILSTAPKTATAEKITNLMDSQDIFIKPNVPKMKSEYVTSTAARSKTDQSTSIYFKQSVAPAVKQETAQTSRQETQQVTKQVLGLGSSQVEKQAADTQQAQKSRQLLAQPELSILKLKETSRQKLKQSIQDILKTRPAQPKAKINLFGLGGLPSSRLKYLASKTETQPELFKVYGRRFGQDIEILSTPSKQKAEEKLKGFLSGTLARSGYITKSGEPIKSDLLKSFVFRPSKKDSFRVVEKSKFALSSFSERKEIQYFKRKAKGKKKGFDWL